MKKRLRGRVRGIFKVKALVGTIRETETSPSNKRPTNRVSRNTGNNPVAAHGRNPVERGSRAPRFLEVLSSLRCVGNVFYGKPPT